MMTHEDRKAMNRWWKGRIRRFQTREREGCRGKGKERPDERKGRQKRSEERLKLKRTKVRK